MTNQEAVRDEWFCLLKAALASASPLGRTQEQSGMQSRSGHMLLDKGTLHHCLSQTPCLPVCSFVVVVPSLQAPPFGQHSRTSPGPRRIPVLVRLHLIRDAKCIPAPWSAISLSGNFSRIGRCYNCHRMKRKGRTCAQTERRRC